MQQTVHMENACHVGLSCDHNVGTDSALSVSIKGFTMVVTVFGTTYTSKDTAFCSTEHDYYGVTLCSAHASKHFPIFSKRLLSSKWYCCFLCSCFQTVKSNSPSRRSALLAVADVFAELLWWKRCMSNWFWQVWVLFQDSVGSVSGQCGFCFRTVCILFQDSVGSVSGQRGFCLRAAKGKGWAPNSVTTIITNRLCFPFHTA